jgi:hypothetical protein
MVEISAEGYPVAVLSPQGNSPTGFDHHKCPNDTLLTIGTVIDRYRGLVERKA